MNMYGSAAAAAAPVCFRTRERGRVAGVRSGTGGGDPVLCASISETPEEST